MQKKLIALAVAGLVSGGAFAQASNVTIYGRANLVLDNYAATGSVTGPAADYAGRTRIVDSSSRIGFKGTEALGNGLQMNWQCESQVNMNQGGTNGMNGSVRNSSVGLCGRQSYAGLSGGWGEFRLGRQEVYWTDGRINDIGANELATNGGIATGGGGIVGGVYSRTSNVLSYFTPTMSGFQGGLLYVAGAEAAQQGTAANGKGYSFVLNYNNGPIAVKYDWAKSYGQNAAGNLSTPVTGQPQNTGSKLAMAYFYQGESKVGLVLVSEQNANGAALAGLTAVSGAQTGTLVLGNTLKQNSWDLSWEHYWGSGNFQSIVEYGKSSNASLSQGGGASLGTMDTSQTNAKQFTIAGKYFFSKRTAMYLTTEKITNGMNNWQDFSNGGYSASAEQAAGTGLSVISRGVQVKVTALGLIHNF